MKKTYQRLVTNLRANFRIKYILILLLFTSFIFCKAWSQIFTPVVDKTQIKNIEKKDNSLEPKGHGNIGDILKSCEHRRVAKPQIEKINEVDIDGEFAIKLALVRVGKQMKTTEKIFSIIPLHNLEENIVGYDIDIILDGRTWPDYVTVANEWRNFCEEQAKNVRVKNYTKLQAPSEGRKTQSDVYTAYTISATYDTPPIRATRGGVSNFYATGWIAQEIASDILGVREPILRKVYMVGPLERSYLFENNNRAIIVEGQAPWSYYEYESYIEFSKTEATKRKETVYEMIKENGFSPNEVIENIRNENRIKTEEILNMSFIPRSEHYIYGHDSLFEPFEWHYGCAPTSGAMVLNYWENYSWYGKLNYWFFMEYDNIGNGWDCHVSTLHESMAGYMYTNSTGGTVPANIYPGMLNYANDTGYNFSGGPNWTGYPLYWHWTAIRDEIDGDYPFVWTNDWYASGRHSVAAVGYDDTYMEVLFYNTWGYGSGNVIDGCSYSGGAFDFSFGAAPHPGGPVYYDVKIEIPDGYQVYGNCGTSGTYYVGNTIDITWNNFSSPGHHVNIFYSIDGGDDWTFIVNTNDDGSYNWTIPSDAITEYGRICIQQYSSTSTLVSSDGSYGDFEILQNPNYDPELTSGDVVPDEGTTETLFTYTAHYYDQDGDAPSLIKVYIDGTGHDMGLYSGSSSNGTYHYQTYLSIGNHNYYFYCEDGNGGDDRLPSSGTYTGPNVTQPNNEPPQNLAVTEQGYATWDAPSGGTIGLYSQWDFLSAEGGISAQDFEAAFDAYDAEGADEFVVPSGETWTINEVAVLGSYSAAGPCDLANVRFYADASGMPGTLLFEYLYVAANPDVDGNLDCFIPNTPFTNGIYWISVQGRLDFGTCGQWYWKRQQAPTIGYEFHWQNPLDGFGTGYTTWVSGSTQWPTQTDYNLSFALYGSISDGKTTVVKNNINPFMNKSVERFPVKNPDISLLSSVPTTSTSFTCGQSINSRDLLGYKVYLDAVYTDMTTDTFWQYTGLVSGQTYTAGVSALYDEGESDMVTIDFTYIGGGNPIIAVDPTFIYEILDPDQVVLVPLEIENTGTAELTFDITVVETSTRKKNPFSNIGRQVQRDRKADNSTEYSPYITPHYQSTSDETGDILFEFDAQTQTSTICPGEDNQLLGAEFDGTCFWATGGGGTVASMPNQIYKYDVDGNIIAFYPQNTTSSWGMRDLAWDESSGYLYAGDNDGFYQIDPADGSVTTLFSPTGMGTIRALALLPDGTFWTKSFSGDIYIFDIVGNIINSYVSSVSAFGAAYDPVNNCVWVFEGTTANTPATTFSQWDCVTQDFTGISIAVTLLSGLTDQVKGGAFYTQDYATGFACLGGMVQGTPFDKIFLMELENTENWISVDPISGTVPAGGFEIVNVNLYATDLFDITKTADIVIANNAGDDVIVPVTMEVIGTVPPLSLTIYEIQYTTEPGGASPYEGERVETSGVVTAVFENSFFIQDGSGAWNGINIYPLEAVSLGDEIILIGDVLEYNGKTEITDIISLQISGTSDLPEPVTISTDALANSESYEGVLVKVEDVTVTNDDLGYGEWEINDGSGPCIVDDLGVYTYVPALDDFIYSITGIVDYSFGNFKLEPRNDDDFVYSGSHFETVWQGNGYNNMTFFITLVTIDGIDMEAGDEIGIFDGEICVGAGTLTGEIPPIFSMAASADDPITPTVIDGFIDGNEISYKLWDASEGIEISYVVPSYSLGDGTFLQLGTAMVGLEGFSYVEQTIDLISGWNMISFYNEPDDMDMMSIMQPLIDAGVLVKVQDESGQALVELPPPTGWYNGIGDMATTEGYYINVNDSTQLYTVGMPVPLPKDIPLITNWNMMSYPVMTPQDALAAVQPLIDAGVLVKVQNESGQAIVELPPPIGWYNGIGDFLPGEGYYINVNANVTLTIYEPVDFAQKGKIFTKKKTQQLRETSHFIPIWNNNPYMAMNVFVNSIDIEELTIESGDELGIFDGEICVGSSVIENGEVISLIASTDDPITEEIDGFSVGNEMSFRFWDSSEDTEIDIIVTEITGDETFTSLGTSIVELQANMTSNNNELIPTVTKLGQNYPNPFNPSTTINLSIKESGYITLEIYNIKGQIVRTLINEFREAGYHVAIWDGTDDNHNQVSSGIYLFKMNEGNQIMLKKMLLVK